MNRVHQVNISSTILLLFEPDLWISFSVPCKSWPLCQCHDKVLLDPNPPKAKKQRKHKWKCASVVKLKLWHENFHPLDSCNLKPQQYCAAIRTGTILEFVANYSQICSFLVFREAYDALHFPTQKWTKTVFCNNAGYKAGLKLLLQLSFPGAIRATELSLLGQKWQNSLCMGQMVCGSERLLAVKTETDGCNTW